MVKKFLFQEALSLLNIMHKISVATDHQSHGQK
jgi:hypothetical protein